MDVGPTCRARAAHWMRTAKETRPRFFFFYPLLPSPRSAVHACVVVIRECAGGPSDRDLTAPSNSLIPWEWDGASAIRECGVADCRKRLQR